MTVENQIDPASIAQAADRLRGVANHTPVMTSRTLNERVGAEVFVKCENFQRTGSFKFRGAYNAVSQLSADERERGIITYSSGNHAQALALAGRLVGTEVVVVMPRSAPKAKRDATAGYGAEVVDFDEDESVREEVAAELQEERGLTLVPPYDHPAVVAGQGTAARELIAAVPGLDSILVPCGGGGLLSGTILAASTVEACRVIGVEPEAADDATRSFQTGSLHRVRNPDTIADGLRTPSLGRWTWPIIRERASEMVTVSDEEIVEAMRFFWTRMKLMVEPSGAVALAALMKNGPVGARKVGLIISGGNLDTQKALELLHG